MKKTALIFTALLLVAGLTVNGQTEHDHGQKSEQQGMMQGGMMQPGMMQGMRGMMQQQQMPMQKYMMMVNRLPNMQEQLSLTSEQSKQLIDLQAAFKKQQVDYKAEQGEKRMKLESLLDNKASSDEVKQQMQDCAETKINMGIAAYETAGKMKALLNDDQKEKMKNMMMMQSGMMQKGQGGMMQKEQGGMMQKN